MSRLIDADKLGEVKFHPLPYIHITPSDVEAESYKRGWNDAIDSIIDDAPTIEPEPCEDAVSRQAAIDGRISIQRTNGVEIYCDEAVPVGYLKRLPPAQPDIIRCKDCYWWTKQEDSLQGRCDRYGHYPTGAWFCASAKRREK